MLDLSAHLATKANLDLLRARFPGLKVYVAEGLSNAETTVYVLESDARKKAMRFAMPSDATLLPLAPIIRDSFVPFYDRHRVASIMGAQ